MTTAGILHLAFGERYEREAKASIRLLRRTNPSLPVAVVTDRPWDTPHDSLPNQFISRPAMVGFRCKSSYIFEASPFQRTLYLDTDARVVRDIRAIFSLLDHYDIGVSFTGPWLGEGELWFHPQCSSAEVLFRRNEANQGVFRDWQALHAAAASSLSSSDPRGVGDQRYLAIAIARSNARPIDLGGDLQFQFCDSATAHRPPLIYLECRGPTEAFETLDAQLTSDWDSKTDWSSRTWWPQARSFIRQFSRRELLRRPLILMALVLLRLDGAVDRWRLATILRRS